MHQFFGGQIRSFVFFFYFFPMTSEKTKKNISHDARQKRLSGTIQTAERWKRSTDDQNLNDKIPLSIAKYRDY